MARCAFLILLSFCLSAVERADIVVYGGSAAGVTAAIEASRQGRSVLLVTPEKHIGGMAVEGLGSSDINNHWFRNDYAVGGLAKEFYDRIGAKYGKDGPVYLFESHVAEAVYAEMLAATAVKILRQKRLKEPLNSSIRWKGNSKKIAAITLEDGSVIEGDYFIDATIEADLLAAAGVETVIGRESNAKYGETKNGIRDVNTYRQFPFRIDPYREQGNPKSGLLPTIQDEPLGTAGEGDHRIQGYCFRSCLTRNAANQIPFRKPEGYDPKQYELYRRYVEMGGELYYPVARLPNGKTDLGSWHDLSANLYGMNFDYPGGNSATRKRIYDQHRHFVEGLFWFLANDDRLPEKTKERWRGWGLCRDEFTDNGGWPRQFYVRDGRRMVSDYVITEHHTRKVNPVPVDDPVALAYWPTDMHHVRRIVRDGAVYNEGFVFDDGNWGPFGISYRALVPRRSEAVNLLTAAAPSSSHVAYGAIRIEYTFMALGQATGMATALAWDRKLDVQTVSYAELRRRLEKVGQPMNLNLIEAKKPQ